MNKLWQCPKSGNWFAESLHEVQKDMSCPCDDKYCKNKQPDGPYFKLRKFLPGSDLPDGRYVMDGTRCVTVKDGELRYIADNVADGGRTLLKNRTNLEDFWWHRKRPVWGILPLEGEEE